MQKKKMNYPNEERGFGGYNLVMSGHTLLAVVGGVKIANILENKKFMHTVYALTVYLVVQL